MVQILTKPWPWIAILGWFAVAKFDLGVFGDELRKSLWSMWPFVLLAIVAWIGLTAFKIYSARVR